MRRISMEELFKNPPSHYRGAPLWSWNGKLEDEELIRQIHILKEMGFSGFFMHPRTGLETEYLSEEWFRIVKLCVSEAENLGLKSWIYDEDRWPSGMAGGLVTENPEHKMKSIALEIVNKTAYKVRDEEDFLGAWSCNIRNKYDVYDLEPIHIESDLSAHKGKKVLTFKIVDMQEHEHFNGNAYADVLSKEAMATFFELTLERYKKHCGDYFGTTIPGVFTDEPQRGDFLSGRLQHYRKDINPYFLVPYTKVAFDKFQALHGYKIQDQLPQLFLRVEGQRMTKAKADYIEVIQQLFIESFSKPYYEWCDKNNLSFTGHYTQENTLSSQVANTGSIQRMYEHMHIPGIDFLGWQTNRAWTVKQLSSVARQFGHKQLMSELYGCTGWQMDFQEHKSLGAWQALFGINFRVPHLSWYTMKGQAKRDYPASILHQSPWYKNYNIVETWFARLNYFRDQGREETDILVLNPVESIWSQVLPKRIKDEEANAKAFKKLERQYEKLFNVLVGNQIDFHYGDEGILAEHGQVDKAKLSIGQVKYSTILISGMTTIRTTTIELLKSFLKSGGRVIFIGEVAKYVDAEISPKAKELADQSTKIPFKEEAILNEIRTKVKVFKNKTSQYDKSVFSQFLQGDDCDYLIVLNADRKEGISGQNLIPSYFYPHIKLPKNKHLEVRLEVESKFSQVEEWDLDSGEVHKINSTEKDSQILIEDVYLPPSGVRCFRFVKESNLSKQILINFDNRKTLNKHVKYSLSEPNVLVLDKAKWTFNNKRHGKNYILQIDRLIRKQLGIDLRSGGMVQPWKTRNEEVQSFGKLDLEYDFYIKKNVIDGLDDMYFVCEDPSEVTVEINGKTLRLNQDFGYWRDVAFRKFKLDHTYLKTGRNTITMSCDYNKKLNLEAIYLIGDFGVDVTLGRNTLRQLPETIKHDNLVKQGLAYYSGSIRYEYELAHNQCHRNIEVTLPKYKGAYAKLMSDDKTVMIPWKPGIARIEASEKLIIEVSITSRNTFGPFYNPVVDFQAMNPGLFEANKWMSLFPNFIKSGFLGRVKIKY